MALRRYLAGALLLAACGDDSAPAGAAGAGGAPYTLDDVCERAVPRFCAAREPCCDAIGAAFSEAGCVAEQRARCDDNVAAVRRGELAFDPTHIDACIEDFERLYQRCFLSPVQLIFELADGYAVCDLFRGSVAPGDACELDAECAGPSGPGFSGCGDASGVCEQARVLGEGESCGAARYCAPGLYCDLMPGTPPAGICEEALGLGDACAAPLACGNGRFCDGATLQCTPTKPGGMPCAGDLECTSLVCLENACVAVPPVVDPAQCGG